MASSFRALMPLRDPRLRHGRSTRPPKSRTCCPTTSTRRKYGLPWALGEWPATRHCRLGGTGPRLCTAAGCCCRPQQGGKPPLLGPPLPVGARMTTTFPLPHCSYACAPGLLDTTHHPRILRRFVLLTCWCPTWLGELPKLWL